MQSNIPPNTVHAPTHRDIVPYGGKGVAWDLREMGSDQGKGAREDQAPQTRKEISSKEGGNMEQEEEGKKSQAGPKRTQRA